MSLNDITIVYSGVTSVYSVQSVNGNTALYQKVGSSMVEPEVLERNSARGDGYKKPSRHLVKLSSTKKDPVAPTTITSGGVHVVFTESATVGQSDLILLWNRLKVYLTDAKIGEILAGSLS